MLKKTRQNVIIVSIFPLFVCSSFLLLSFLHFNNIDFVLLPDILGFITLLNSFLIILWVTQNNSHIRKIIVAAFCFRTFLALIGYYIAPLPYSGDDAIFFENLGWEWSQDGLSSIIDNFTIGSYFYAWLISTLYTLVGRSPLMIQGFNVLFGSLIVWNIYLTTKLLWNKRIANRAAWIITLFPSTALYSAITLREVLIMYPLTLGILCLVRWHRSGSIHHFLLFFLLLILCISIHSAITVILVALIFLFAIRILRNMLANKANKLIRYTISLLFILSIFGAVLLSGFGLQKIGGSVDQLSLENIEKKQQVKARSNAAYLGGMSIKNPVDLVIQTPLRITYFLYAPFLWMIRSPSDVVAQIDILLYLYLTVSLYRSRHDIKSNSAASTIFFILLALLVGLAMGTSNYGTALRHRAKLAPIAISLIVMTPREHKIKH